MVFKDCCEACKIGMEAGNSGQSCQSAIGLGAMMDGAFEACCKQTSTTTSTTKSTTEFPTSIITKNPDDSKGSASLPRK